MMRIENPGGSSSRTSEASAHPSQSVASTAEGAGAFQAMFHQRGGGEGSEAGPSQPSAGTSQAPGTYVPRRLGAPQVPGGETHPHEKTEGHPGVEDLSPSRFEQRMTLLDQQGRQATAVTRRFDQLNANGPANHNLIRATAQDAYRHPDASPHSINTAYQADRTSESQRWHSRPGITNALRMRPTPAVIERVFEATAGTPNAQIMAEVIRRDPHTINSYSRQAGNTDAGPRIVNGVAQDLASTDTNADPVRQQIFTSPDAFDHPSRIRETLEGPPPFEADRPPPPAGPPPAYEE